MSPLSSDRAMTLLEVLMVTAILAIGAAVAAWGLNLILPDLRLKEAARNLKSNMQLARLTAIRHNAVTVSEFNTDNNSYRIYLDDGGGDTTKANNYVQNPGERVLLSVRLHPQVEMTSAKFGAVEGRFGFNSRGALDGLAGGVYMHNTLNTYRGVTVSRIGKITIKGSEDGQAWHGLN